MLSKRLKSDLIWAAMTTVVLISTVVPMQNSWLFNFIVALFIFNAVLAVCALVNAARAAWDC